MRFEKMKKYFELMLILGAVNLFAQYGDINIDNYIQNAEMFAENQIDPTAILIPFASYDDCLNKSEQESGYFKSLNGKWQFNLQNTPYTFDKDFFTPDYNDKNWDNIIVPGTWQMQGFDHLVYRNVPMEYYPYDPPRVPTELNPSGAYRRTFTIPDNWDGRKILLHFDGVKSNAFVWINGKYTGYDEGSMTPAEFDITEYLKDGENQITVLTTRWCSGSYLEDQDMWRFAGIYRDVYLYAKPVASINNLFVKTDLDENYRDAELNLNIGVNTDDGESYKVRYTLLDDDLIKVLSETSASTAAEELSSFMISVEVANPKKWSDEFPNLYTIVLELLNKDGNAVDVVKERIGFRKLEIINGIAHINGVPFYARGTNRHEHHPDLGRTMTREMMIKDIMLLKQHNMNAVRTSHYPNAPLWYELCDEYGIILMDEVNAECHYTEYVFPGREDYAGTFMDRFVRMVERDKNHPSILIWSTGNECGLDKPHYEMAKFIKEYDPERFLMHQSNTPDGYAPYSDINGQRYPSVAHLMHIGMSTEKPVMLGEYAHAMGNSLGHFDELWNTIYSMPRLQGGFIWDWVDQGLNVELPVLIDQSSNQIKSSLMGSPKMIEGVKGKAIQLSGMDDWIEIYNHPVFDDLYSELRVEFYVKPGLWLQENPLVVRANQFGIIQFSEDSLSFYVNNRRNAVTVAVPDDWQYNWHYIQAVFSNKELKLLINGKLKGSKKSWRNLEYSEFPVNIGRDYSRTASQHLGFMSTSAIDEVKISGSEGVIYHLSFDEEAEIEKVVYYGSDSFDCNGIVFHDRTPQPELIQAKKSQSPVRFKMLESGSIEISNNYSFTNLNTFDFNWFLYADGEQVESGNYEVECKPFESTTREIPVSLDKYPGKNILLELSAVLKEDHVWAEKGYEINFEQFELTSTNYQLSNLRVSESGKISETDSRFIFPISEKSQFTIDKSSGKLEYTSDSKVILAGAELNVWRAPISNELVDWGRNEAGDWYKTGLNRLILDKTEVASGYGNSSVIVKQLYRLPRNDDYIVSKFTYSYYGKDALNIKHDIEFIGRFNYDWLPRVGMTLNIPKEFVNVEWSGRGPLENYPDRKSGYKLGNYKASITDFYVPYVKTENHGNRSDVRHVGLKSTDGSGLEIIGSEKFNFSVNPFSNLDRTVYPFQLEEAEYIKLNIDADITGLGGTPVPVMPDYRVYPVRTVYSIIVIPEIK